MRGVLARGKQKELVENAKNNLTWKQLSTIIGVSEGYLKNELRNEGRTLNLATYKKLCETANENFDSFILKFLNENWGRQKGGKNSSHNPRTPKLLTQENSEELAEFFGIMYGDGHCYEILDKGIYQVRIFGHLVNDYEYIQNFVGPLAEKLFNLKFGTYFKKNIKVIILAKHSKNLVFTLKHFGLRPGNKSLSH